MVQRCSKCVDFKTAANWVFARKNQPRYSSERTFRIFLKLGGPNLQCQWASFFLCKKRFRMLQNIFNDFRSWEFSFFRNCNFQINHSNPFTSFHNISEFRSLVLLARACRDILHGQVNHWHYLTTQLWISVQQSPHSRSDSFFFFICPSFQLRRSRFFSSCDESECNHDEKSEFDRALATLHESRMFRFICKVRLSETSCSWVRINTWSRTVHLFAKCTKLVAGCDEHRRKQSNSHHFKIYNGQLSSLHVSLQRALNSWTLSESKQNASLPRKKLYVFATNRRSEGLSSSDEKEKNNFIFILKLFKGSPSSLD